MTDGGPLAFSAAELAHLAQRLGGRFPGLGGEPPGQGTREQLVRRGVLDASGAVADDATRTAVQCALSGSALTLTACDGPRVGLVTFFFTAPDAVVRHEVDEAGVHTLEHVERDTARAGLDDIVRGLAGAPGAAPNAVAVDHERVSEATRLVAGGEPDRARAVLPEAPGYVAALTDVRLVVTVAAHARADEKISATSVSVVHSPSHGLWLLDSAAAGSGDDEVTIERVSASAVAARLQAMLDDTAPLSVA